ncbi:Rhamnogalacturonase B, N-terminal-domain-containing protein [Cladochytrium replicatum]|nr:Rhamnogalacturonase B, N-terminal-domain-containing protein [Cladochytrium replicatum]
MMAKVLVVAAALAVSAFVTPAEAVFGFTTSSGSTQVDSGAGLVFKVSSTCDINSIIYNGIQVQDASKFTHLSSGLGSAATVSAKQADTNTVLVTCTTSTLTHYMAVRKNVNNIHLATFISAEPSVGELRFIARLKRSAVPNGIPASDLAGNVGAVEGSDVYKLSNGQTRSKFYSGINFINDQVHGVTGSGVGVYMVIPGNAYESSSGGPFFRDINNQGGDQQELYWYMNSGHTQTEAYRTNVLYGPYALVFTTGGAPSASLDMSFFDSLGIKGLFNLAGRGRLTGKVTGLDTSLFPSNVVVGFKNSVAQYWCNPRALDQRYASPYMKPGTYIVTVYKYQLEVGTGTAVVTAGGTTTFDIAANNAANLVTPPSSLIFQIGELDGTPSGFLNAEKLPTMHPSDVRMSSWTATKQFTVGSSAVNTFPAVLWKSVNSPYRIVCTLSAAQASSARTLRIGITLAFAGGRPQINVNNGKWSSSIPSPSAQPDSRGITRGTFRGNNVQFTYAIPANSFVAGSNTIDINVVSGSSGDTFLSPNFVVDVIQLY